MGFKAWICRTFKCTEEVSPDDLDDFDWERFWNTKKQRADISYCGRVLPTTKIPLEIDVKLFVTPNDFEIYNWLKERNLLTSQKNTAGCNDLILKIYKEHQKEYFSYGSDEDTFNVKELWVYPQELRALRKNGRKLDCDDFGSSLASHYICAGIPDFRVRCVCGTTRGGEGHYTVYVLADDMKTWKHTNSTTSYQNIPNRFEDLPSSKSENDSIGIKDVWMSFNNEMSWTEFYTESSPSNSFLREGKFKILINR